MANTFISNGEAEYAKGGILTSSGSFKSRRKSAVLSKANSEVDDIINLLHGSDPVRVELNRLDNEVRDKDRELGDAQAEIKALRYSERLKEKAVEELTDELDKAYEKLKVTEALLESKNLEIKKTNDEKRAAMAAQFAAEATLRRVHAAQKDDEMPPIEAIITPLEAELKLARQEVAKLQDDNRALDRLTKSKEAALLEAEKSVEISLAKASLVDDLQNKNQDLMKQIEICQSSIAWIGGTAETHFPLVFPLAELYSNGMSLISQEENKILDQMHRQKVAEVEKLTQTVRELEEAVLAGGAAANAVRDYQRRVQEMNEEKKTLDRELARAKVSANRVATVVANEWKDGNDKVMPVKQWLEERKFYQACPCSYSVFILCIQCGPYILMICISVGEMQQLRDKLAIAERTAKAEAQMKEKYLLRFKVLEEKLKATSNGNSRPSSEAKGISNGSSRCQSFGGAEALSKSPSSGFSSRRTSNSHSGPLRSYSACALLKRAKISSRSFDGGSRSLERDKVLTNFSCKVDGAANVNDNLQNNDEILSQDEVTNRNPVDKTSIEQEDLVSGMLYDMLQKEVLTLRKACHEKDQTLKDKDDAIEMLAKKVDTLNKAMDVEAKRMRREVASMEKEVAAMRVNKEQEIRVQRFSAPRAAVNRSQSFTAR
ncbi:Microtubule-associated protein 70 [Dillenia turbinata]|uniref:Microtubule-associated protein 70 n=1 Tax=Dillenia turbinata TaxID=194707 RepID=A0AAN8W2P0_9MAGN